MNIAPKKTYQEYKITLKNGIVSIENGGFFESEAIYRHLNGCSKCIILAITLGAEIDKHLNKLQYVSMAQAINEDKIANISIENACSALQKEIELKMKKEGYKITKRFSPGFEDFSLNYQPMLLKLTNAEKEIGLTTTNDNLLIPQKSITAVIGCYK